MTATQLFLGNIAPDYDPLDTTSAIQQETGFLNSNSLPNLFWKYCIQLQPFGYCVQLQLFGPTCILTCESWTPCPPIILTFVADDKLQICIIIVSIYGIIIENMHHMISFDAEKLSFFPAWFTDNGISIMRINENKHTVSFILVRIDAYWREYDEEDHFTNKYKHRIDPIPHSIHFQFLTS